METGLLQRFITKARKNNRKKTKNEEKQKQ
jgi:hypothetical protein